MGGIYGHWGGGGYMTDYLPPGRLYKWWYGTGKRDVKRMYCMYGCMFAGRERRTKDFWRKVILCIYSV